MAEQDVVNKVDELKLSQGRSPAYPYIALPKAIERIEQIAKAGGARQALPPETFYKIWGIGAQSSGARQTMAALNHFGLVDYIGRGDDRKVKLSDLALRIALDKQPGSTDRAKAIKEAALSPPIHGELMEKYGNLLPDDVVMETYLVRDRGYNTSAATALIGEYKDTLAVAGLDKPMDLHKNGDRGRDSDQLPVKVRVGDIVQWESNGVLRLSEPKRVTNIAETGDFVFVEGSMTGVPMSEVTVVQQGTSADQSGAATAASPPIKPAPLGARQDVFSLDEGQVVLQWPAKMSATSFEDFESWIELQLRKIKRGIEQ